MTVGAAGGQADVFAVVIDGLVAETFAGNIVVKGEVGQLYFRAFLETPANAVDADEVSAGVDKTLHAGFDAADFLREFASPRCDTSFPCALN